MALSHSRPVRTVSPTITRIGVSLAGGWLVGIGVPPSVRRGPGDAAGNEVGVLGTTVEDPTVGDSGVDIDAGVQAATEITARMNTVMW